MASVVLRNVTKAWGDTVVSKDIDLTIREGEFVVFVGPSGCGKSTLLRMIAGLETITSGELLIGDQRMNDVPPAERGIGMVFQSYALYPHLSVAENMSFGLKLAGVKKAEIHQRVNQVAEILQLAHLLDRRPKALSGGQRQRVAIGRTLVAEPRVFLLDEPLSNLDAALRVQMRIEISRLHKRLKRTMIYVTHDQIEAMTLADKIVVLDAGRIAQVGKPLELYHYPANRFVAGFIGSPKMNFLRAEISATGAGEVQLRVPELKIEGLVLKIAADCREGQTVTLGIRPEHFQPAAQTPDALRFHGELAYGEMLGHTNYLYLDIGREQMLVVEEREATTRELGTQVELGFSAAHCLLFDEQGMRLR